MTRQGIRAGTGRVLVVGSDILQTPRAIRGGKARIVRRVRAIALATLVLLGAFVVSVRMAVADNPQQDPATFWNQLTTHFAQAARLSPPRLARAYALVQVAIYDALLGSGRTHDGEPSQVAIAAGAASEVLTYLFPSNAGPIAENETAQVASAQARHS